MFDLAGISYFINSLGLNPLGEKERIGVGFAELVDQAYKRSGAVGAVLMARILPFSQLRFQFQEMNGGRPGDLFDDPSLLLVRRPWAGAVTQDLLARMELLGGLAGNAFVVKRRNRLKVPRPDRMTIIRGIPEGEEDSDDPLDMDIVGYGYAPGGQMANATILRPSEVAHYAPLPDPAAEYRGMSWLTPVIRNVASHSAAVTHKLKFFENGATPNLLVKWGDGVDEAKAKIYQKLFLEGHQSADNAYKTLFMAGGGDATVLGRDFQQMTFKEIQGADETLIAANAGVPPIIANLSEGLAASTYSNYGQAKKHYADTTVYYLAEQAASSLESILPAPRAGTRLWFDMRDIPFFRDDAKSEAEVHKSETEMMRSLIDGGWEPESVKKAILAGGDWSLLVHTGKLSVQLQDPNQPPSQET